MQRLIFVLIVMMILSACGGEEGGQPTSTMTNALGLATDTATRPTSTNLPPTPTATHSSTQPSPSSTEPTQIDVSPTTTPTPSPRPTSVPATPTAAPTASGQVSFRSNLAVADQLVFTMQAVDSPAEGTVYEGWLVADDDSAPVSTGVFQVGPDGKVDHRWVSPTGENLIAKYDGFVVTLEPVEDNDPTPSNEVVLEGAADSNTLAAARRIFAINDGEPSTPRNTAYGLGLLAESLVAKNHVLNAFNAAAIGAYSEMRVHAEHVVNIIEGSAGPRFADHNGDGRAESPGDGFGALAYARQMAALFPSLNDDLGPLEELLIAIQDKAEEILAAPDIATAQPLLDDFKAMGERLFEEAAPAFYGAAESAVSYPVVPVP